MASLRTLTSELSALGALAISMPLRFVLPRERFDPAAPHPTPVVFVHGFLGDPTNFLVLRSFLSGRGIRNFASFSYPPRLDYQRLAGRLEQTIEAVCLAAGAPEVDVVGHSLGGLVARYLVELGDGRRVRRSRLAPRITRTGSRSGSSPSSGPTTRSCRPRLARAAGSSSWAAVTGRSSIIRRCCARWPASSAPEPRRRQLARRHRKSRPADKVSLSNFSARCVDLF